MPQEQEQRFREQVLVNGEQVISNEGTIEELGEKARKQATSSKLKGLTAKGGTAETVIEVAKFVWDIIKDSKASAATEETTSRVLSVKDTNWENYELAKNFASDEITYKLDNFVGVNCYTVKFKVAGTYKAVNPDFGGKWIPNIHVTFSRCDANIPWVINGSAVIDSTYVSNIGTKENPIPQLVLNIKIKTDAKFALNWESHERTFEFILNGETGVKLIN
ncbi:hypothetical protein NHF50_02820 [Flavobacterium sp. NRK F10]|uniref:Uncharacterized protein n=1 Tax=Flavobacterium sediminis TaxID=2201181 RepID=A0A2U8QRQ2_9FLAO|nr:MULTISPECIES: hypothetical protein [Flavobacterium]AWM12840.1 hypothetical protein DI487_02445 [Flavobacterium sediminis]MCO6173967.1 hypothetical protein [Flavobacterium sp. NRK F10]